MSDAALGLVAVVFQLFGAGAVILWPEHNWIGWLFVGFGSFLLLVWASRENYLNTLSVWFQSYKLQWPIAKRHDVMVPEPLHGGNGKRNASERAQPLSETSEERKAKDDLVAFVAEYVLPTYEAQIALQEEIVRTICPRSSAIGTLAWVAHQNGENMRQYKEHIEMLTKATTGEIVGIPLERLIDEVDAVGKLHHALCSFPAWLAGREFDYKSDATTAELYRNWRARQTALLEAFQPFRRDMRFGRFYDRSGRRRLGEGFETDA